MNDQTGNDCKERESAVASEDNGVERDHSGETSSLDIFVEAE